MTRLSRIASSLVLAATLAGAAHAQTIDRVIPQTAAPGDLVIIEGQNLGGVTAVDFFSVPGGFVGVWTETAVPQTVTATRLTVVRPDIPIGFIAPFRFGSSPGSPNGTVRVKTTTTQSPTVPFFYIEGTFIEVAPDVFESPQTTTMGTGTTQSTGRGKPVATFDLSGGAPATGNPDFVVELENGVATTPAALLLGFPAATPFPLIGDGTFVVDPALPFVTIAGLMTDANGDAGLPAPIPPTGFISATLVFQWVLIDSAQAAVSNGLSFRL